MIFLGKPDFDVHRQKTLCQSIKQQNQPTTKSTIMSDPISSSALATLTELSSAHPDLSSTYYSPLSSLYSKKLWHQLTVSALDFLSDPSTLRLDNNNNNNESSSNHLTLFQKVLLPIEKKLNSLSLVRMASLVAFSLPQKEDGLAVLQPLMSTTTSSSDSKDRFGCCIFIS